MRPASHPRLAGATALVLAAVLAGASTAPPAAAGSSAVAGIAVEGRDTARLLPPPGARVVDYENAGYRLERRGDEVVIEVDTSPLESRTPFVMPRRPPRDAVERLARGIVSGSHTTYEASSRLLAWVASHLEYDLDRTMPQGAAAVLERRRGYCTGIARATVALFLAAGIEAREVAGYVVDAERPTGGFHRFVEVRLPDRGWVFSDPLASHHYVPATYVRLASEELEVDSGIEGLLLQRFDEVEPVDLYRPAPAGVTARRNTARRLAASLAVEVPGGRGGAVTLVGLAVRHRLPLAAERAVFVGLEPDLYRVRVELPTGGVVEREVWLEDRLSRMVRMDDDGGLTRR